MEEMPESMVRVEMADQTELLVSSLERVVQQIQEKVVGVELQLPLSHPTLAVLLQWVEQAVLDWSSFNIPLFRVPLTLQ
jgi:hypothetical protein